MTQTQKSKLFISDKKIKCTVIKYNKNYSDLFHLNIDGFSIMVDKEEMKSFLFRNSIKLLFSHIEKDNDERK